MLEAKDRWNATKISILQHNLKIFAKYLVDACTFNLTVFILSQWTQHLTLLASVFFVINLSTDSVFDESFNCSNSLSGTLTLLASYH